MSTLNPPAPVGAIPTARQLAWHQLQNYAFVHFGPNTFYDQEWGHGTEDPNRFQPSKLDCEQWCRVFKSAGFTGVIITAKHHDGFCLWPSKFSTHTVAQSSWRGGKGDVVKELSLACKKFGLKFGVYCSPWDRNHPDYGTDQYNETFRNTLHELLTHYGPIFEMWFDGANGEGPNGKKQVYDWPMFHSEVRKDQPNAVMFSDSGPDIRWVGNEAGYSAPTSWSTINRERYVPGTPHYQELTEGTQGGTDWVPAECDVSIRPGWFWRASEDSKVKTVDELMKIWFGSVGQNGNLLLNVPPNSDGLISDVDANRLQEWRKALDQLFASDLAKGATATASNIRGASATYTATNVLDRKPESYWATDDGVHVGTLDLKLKSSSKVSIVWLREHIQLGQRVTGWHLSAKVAGKWKVVAKGTTIGNNRILRFDPVEAQEFALTIDGSLGPICLDRVSLY